MNHMTQLLAEARGEEIRRTARTHADRMFAPRRPPRPPQWKPP
jgi:hypothetical protein